MRIRTKKLLPLGLAMMLAWPGQALAVKVVIDAGHGGSDPGAIGVNGLQEKTAALDIAGKLRDELERRGYETFMTRSTDEFVKLADRVAFTDRIMPDLFVSIHANSYFNPDTRGTMVLYYDRDYPQEDYPASEAMSALTPESKSLAQSVLDAVVEEAGTVNKGLDPNAAYVVRMGSVPSILVETAFLSNAADASALADPAFRGKLALGVAKGIEAYKPAVAGPFRDLPASHWAYAAVLKLKEQGVVEGEYGRFYPERALTRAEFVSMIERQFPNAGIPKTDGTACEQGTTTVTNSTYGTPCTKTPTDLPVGHWAYDALIKAIKNGLIDGYDDGTIRPDRTITRGEAAVLIDRAIPLSPTSGGSKPGTAVPFKDVPASLWSAPSINRLKQAGLVDGIAPQTFAPERAVTRAEISAILARIIP